MADERSRRPSHTERGSVIERTTVIVAVNTEQDEDAQLATIHQQVGEGWRVVHKVPIEGSTSRPGGNAEHVVRFQVTLQRELEPGPGEQMVVKPRGEDAIPPDDPGEPTV